MNKTHVLNALIEQFTPLPSATSTEALAGKVVLITGANSGIGLQAAHQLAAQRPARLILACRDMTTAATGLDGILRRYPGTNAEVWSLDLADFASVKDFAVRAGRELNVLDVTVLNAGMNPGVVAGPMRTSKDGHEVTQQVNVLGTILLALLLAPLLSRASAPSMVITSSEVHAWADPHLVASAVRSGSSILQTFDNKASYANPARYFESKLLLQLVVRQLIPALPGIKIVSVNPGMCRSNLAREVRVNFVLNGIWQVIQYTIARSAWSGAVCVTKAIEETESVEYYSSCAPAASQCVFLGTATGMRASKQYYAEVCAELERVAPGCTKVLQ